MPSKELPKALRLRDLCGQTIEIVDTPLKRIESDLGTSYIAGLADGRTVFLSPSNINNFDGTHAGVYDVVSYPSKFGNEGFALRNHKA